MNNESKNENLRLSFYKLIYDSSALTSTQKNLVNFTSERWSAVNKTYWAEIDMVSGAEGECEKPWVMQVSVFSRPKEDEYAHNRVALLDAIRAAVSVVSASIYNFGTTDASRANPTDTGLDFYPFIRGSGSLNALPGDNTVGDYFKVECYSYRADLQGR